MRILFIHNDYRNPSGEEQAAEALVNLLRSGGHRVAWFRKTSKGLEDHLSKKTIAFFAGIYSPLSVEELKKQLNLFKPDLVQVQNIYPFISPAILRIIKKKGIPIVMRCPNYRLFCPSGLHLDRKGSICEKCLGTGAELNAILNNCENHLVKSTGYALRNFVARTFWKIHTQVDHFLVQSEFQKQKFVANNIPAEKISVVSGLSTNNECSDKWLPGEYVSFIGRVSKEKGIQDFIEAARLLPDIPFKVAGRLEDKDKKYIEHSPMNLEWSGYLDGDELTAFYKNSRIVVVPGKWYEGFPNVIVAAMMYQKPVITSNLGAMASIVDHKKNGILVDPNSLQELVDNIGELFTNPALCQEYGLKAKIKAKKLYTEERIYEELMAAYKKII